MTSSIAATARSVKAPGLVTNTLEFDGSQTMRARMRLPAAFASRCSTSARSVSWVWQIVEADVEFGARLAGDHVAGGVADIDRGEFEVRGLELRAAVVERLVAERHDQPRDIRHRIGGALRIGDVALHAVDIERAGLRAAAADLDAVAERLDIGGLAEHAMVEFLAARRRPLQQLDGAVDGDVFLVAGDQERDRALAVFRGLPPLAAR